MTLLRVFTWHAPSKQGSASNTCFNWMSVFHASIWITVSPLCSNVDLKAHLRQLIHNLWNSNFSTFYHLQGIWRIQNPYHFLVWMCCSQWQLKDMLEYLNTLKAVKKLTNWTPEIKSILSIVCFKIYIGTRWLTSDPVLSMEDNNLIKTCISRTSVLCKSK